MVFLDHSCPQRMAAMTTGYISQIVEEGVRDENSGEPPAVVVGTEAG